MINSHIIFNLLESDPDKLCNDLAADKVIGTSIKMVSAPMPTGIADLDGKFHVRMNDIVGIILTVKKENDEHNIPFGLDPSVDTYDMVLTSCRTAIKEYFAMEVNTGE